MEYGIAVGGRSFVPVRIKESFRPYRAASMVYKIGKDDKGEPALTKLQDSFVTLDRYYGKADKRFEMLIEDFESSNRTSAIFVGSKGCGKTIEMERVAEHFRKKGMPVIYIQESQPVQTVIKLMREIPNAVWLFDEFGKCFRSTDNSFRVEKGTAQHQFLTILSDACLDGSVVLATENSMAAIDENIQARPKRFKYRFTFKKPGLSELEEIYGPVTHSGIRAYLALYFCQKTTWGYDTLNVIGNVLAMNFDNLEDFVEEMGNYNIPPDFRFNVTMSSMALAGVFIRENELHINGSIFTEEAIVAVDLKNNKSIDITKNILSGVQDPLYTGYSPIRFEKEGYKFVVRLAFKDNSEADAPVGHISAEGKVGIYSEGFDFGSF